MKLTIQLPSPINSDQLQKLINHLSKLKDFEFVLDPGYDCKIIINTKNKKSKRGST